MFKGAIYTIVDLLTRCVRALARFRQGPALPERKQDAAGDKAERDAKARPGWERAAREDKIGDEDLGPDENEDQRKRMAESGPEESKNPEEMVRDTMETALFQMGSARALQRREQPFPGIL